MKKFFKLRDKFSGILDRFGGASVAYSLDKLNKKYTGSAVRVRRSIDNAETDIGFVGNSLDTASLESFASGTDAFVTTWYDQSKGGVESPELVTNGGFDTTNDWSFSNVGGTHGWRIDNGRAICDTNAVTANRNLQQFLSTDIQAGKTYKVTLDILQSADNMLFIVGGDSINLPTGTNLNYEFYFTASSTSNALTIFAGSSDLQEIDNISVKEVLENNATQTTNANQPQIVSNGSVVLENGKPTIQFDGVDDRLEASGVVLTQPATYFTTFSPVIPDTSTLPTLFSSISGRIDFALSSSSYRLQAPTVSSAGSLTYSQQLFSIIYNTTNSFSYKNSVVTHNNVDVGANGLNGLKIGARIDNNQSYQGKIQEIIIYDSDQSSNREAIENNINSRYNIWSFVSELVTADNNITTADNNIITADNG